MAVFVAEPVERDGDFVFGELVLLNKATRSVKSFSRTRYAKDGRHSRMREPYSVRNHLVNSPPRAPESHHLLGLGIVGQIFNHLGRAVDFIASKRGATRREIDKGQRSGGEGGLRVVAMVWFFFSSFAPKFRCAGEMSGRSKIVCAALHWLGSLGDLQGPLGADKEVSCDLADKLVSNNVALCLYL